MKPLRATGAVAVLLVALAACSGGTARPVRVGTVGRSTVTEVVEAPATVVARASATLHAAAEGRVAQVLVRDGQRVAPGAVLLRIDSPAARQRLAQAETADQQATSSTVRVPQPDLSGFQAQSDAAANAAFEASRQAAQLLPAPARTPALARIAAAVARYGSARAAATAAVRSFNAGLGSLSRALSSLTSAQRVQTRAVVAVARQAVAALVVRAPIAGVVSLGGSGSGSGAGSDTGSAALSGVLGSLPSSLQGQAQQALGGTGGAQTSVASIAVGAPVGSGAAVATVTDISTLTLTAEVDETDVFLVRPGVPATVDLDALPGARYVARVTSVDLAPTGSTGGGVSYRVRLALGPGRLPDGGPAPPPRPGMSAVADMQVRRAVDAVAVPASAIVRDGSRDAVYVDLAGRARRRPVTLGAQGDELVQVLEGLRPGERVVVHGADTVTAGQKLPWP